jgi:hypothetical protein
MRPVDIVWVLGQLGRQQPRNEPEQRALARAARRRSIRSRR